MDPIIETNNCEEDDIVFANNIATLVVLPYAIRSTVELGIFNVLAKAKKGTKLSAKDIAVEIGSKNPNAPKMLDRLLRLLACHSILYWSLSEDRQQPQLLYSLAPVANYLFNGPNGMSYESCLKLSLDEVFMESWFV